MSNYKNLLKIVFALIVIVVGNYVIVAQSTVTGEWQAEYRAGKNEDGEGLHINFSRKGDRGKSRMGTSFELGELQGLSSSQISASNSSVRFSIVRDAGTIDFQGVFNNGKGEGTFTFNPNPQFVSGMKSRGFDFDKSDSKNRESNDLGDRVFAAATLNVTFALADDLLSSNFGKLDSDDLFKAAIFKIDGKFASEMKASGFQNLTFEDLVKARIFKVDAGFVREVAQLGFQNEPFESLVKMRIFKISPDFISEIRAEGFNNVPIEDLVKMKIFNIDAEFIRKARAEGVPMEVEKLVQKRIGVWSRN
ncbi:MAG TPA: hypothetical protein PKO33_01710 [Pyrinomonadaceae bacterium]|nr:hypothetical protein [Pyrinomonadaceae bacterium]